MERQDRIGTAYQNESPIKNGVIKEVTREVLRDIADAMHIEICGCDDTRCTLEWEIYEWLYPGAFDDRPYTIAELVAEWEAMVASRRR